MQSLNFRLFASYSFTVPLFYLFTYLKYLYTTFTAKKHYQAIISWL